MSTAAAVKPGRTVPAATPAPAAKAKPVKTVLGIDLRRRIVAAVNGLGRGLRIRVVFRGKRAYTDGRMINLPAIRDLAEIAYPIARALIGYAIHEVAHIRYTDFDQVVRSYEAGPLVRKFGNCIEDYRIERLMAANFAGAAADLTAMRIAIHPKVSALTTGWYADPRASGPLALTWTGSRLNKFAVPGVQRTLDAIPAPVRALIENWTLRMKDVGSTEEAIDLAIQFEKEANAYALASQSPDPKKADPDDSEQKDPEEDGNQPAGGKPSEDPAQADPEESGQDDQQDGERRDSEESDAGTEPEATGEDDPSSADPDADDDADAEGGEGSCQDPEAGGTPPGDSGDAESTADADAGTPTPADSGDGGEDDSADGANARDQNSSDESDVASPAPEGDQTAQDEPSSTDPDADAEGDEGSCQDAEAEGTPPGDSGDAESTADADAGDPTPADSGDGTSTDADATDGAPESADAADQGSSDGSDVASPAPEDPQTAPGDAPGSDGASCDKPSQDGSGEPIPDPDGVEDLDFGTSGSRSGDESSEGVPSDDGRIDMNDGLTDDPDQSGPKGGSNASDRKSDGSSKDGRAGSEDAPDPAGDTGCAGSAESDDVAADDDVPTEGPAFDEAPDGDDGEDGDDPFADALDPSAAFDDFIDDLREEIARQGPLPSQAPEATDGEVDPETLVRDLEDANAAAPAYTSSAGGNADEEDGNAPGPGASKHHYDDSRFSPVDAAPAENCQYETMRSSAAGTISTTARTIKRLLMAEERKGVHVNRRDGQFDIRNMSAIVRGTGTCYKRPWEKPAPRTLLAILVDFSGSMTCSSGGLTETAPIELAMTGALAIEQATQGTSVNTALYGYTGNSPHVNLSTFKEGRQSRIITRRRIGSYQTVGMNCTPTGEAMAALALRMEEADEDRKVMLVLTDGTADDTQLCGSVSRLLIRRGIEVVAVGIQNDSVRQWSPVSHVIQNIAELPQALLATIDPRATKRLRRLAA